jgi:hypothetical protein
MMKRLGGAGLLLVGMLAAVDMGAVSPPVLGSPAVAFTSPEEFNALVGTPADIAPSAYQ